MTSDMSNHPCRGLESTRADKAKAHSRDSGAMASITGEVETPRRISTNGDVGYSMPLCEPRLFGYNVNRNKRTEIMNFPS